MPTKKNMLLVLLMSLLIVSCSATQEQPFPDRQREQTTVYTQGDRQLPDGTSHQPLLIYTSIYPLYDFAQKIGGDQVDVKLLIPPGVDAHDFEPTPADLMALYKADLFIYNGLGMESWLDSLVSASDNPNLTLVNSTASLMGEVGSPLNDDTLLADHAADENGHHHHRVKDPHVWLDPLLAKKQAEAIYEGLVKIDPDQAEDYQHNFEELVRSFEALHHQYDQMSQQAERRDFVVSHEAYGYLAARYGLNQVAIAGLSASQEPGPKRMEEIIRFVRENDIKYILFENNVAPKVAQVIQAETGTEVLLLSNLETLSKEDTDQGHDYFSIMERNLDVLTKALGQKAQ